MATNKPATPRIPYFTGWVVWVILILAPVTWYAARNIGTDPGDLPVSNWWWFLIWAGVFVARWVQVILIHKRVEPKWNYPNVQPWSSPLIDMEGRSLGVIDWFACSAGYSYEKALRIYTDDPGRRHQVNTGHGKYLEEFQAAYGH